VWRPEDRAEATYHYLPIDVPPRCPGLRVKLDYDRSAGVIDLGCFGPAGFRGWSGCARAEFVITPSAATPGYLPGVAAPGPLPQATTPHDAADVLEPGEWRVILGLQRIPPGGLSWRVRTALGPAPVPPPPPAPRVPERPPHRGLPAAPGFAWYAGDLHAHTVHSDGALTTDELACLAASRGLDFLAVTDHNTVSHHPLLRAAGERYGVTLLPGQELTTDRGHANAFGDIGWVDFREPAAEWVRVVADRGGLLSINHPLSADCAWRHPLPRCPPLAEVWHCSWLDRRWGGPLAWWQAWGFDVVPVGGSDYHSPDQGRTLGAPTTWLQCPGPFAADAAAADAVLDALAAGRVAISPDPTGPVLLKVDDELVAVDADGALLTDPSGRRRPVRGDIARFPAAPGPHWLEDGETRLLALAA
jgi:hypothetical protein